MNVAPQVRFFGELQPRLVLPGLGADRVIWRGAIGRDPSPSTSVWLGYGWMPQYGDKGFGGEYRSDHRPFLQLLSTLKPESATLVQRTRLEDRLIEGADPSFRLCHLVRYTHPLVDGSPWLWAASDELSVALNAAGGRKAPAHGFVGVDRLLGPFMVEEGCLLDVVRQPTKADDLGRHALLLGAAWNGP